MFTLAALRLARLLLFSGPVIAAIVAPNCGSVTLGWSFNSLDQNPCLVAAYLVSTCFGGSFSISPLQPGYSYVGPEFPGQYDSCRCSTVAYSLISACDACQGGQWITWSKYSYNCTNQPLSTFPNPVPDGTRVPQWALIDVTLEDNWNATKSQAIGDTPELVPGALISTPNSSSTTSTSGATVLRTSSAATSSPTPSPEPSRSGSSPNTGAIVGSIVAGAAVISIVAAAIIFYLRRRHPAPSTASMSQPPMEGVQQPLSRGAAFSSTSTSPPVSASSPELPVTPMRLYNPDDPTTFPRYRSGSLVTMHTTQSQARGYHGLPTV